MCILKAFAHRLQLRQQGQSRWLLPAIRNVEFASCIYPKDAVKTSLVEVNESGGLCSRRSGLIVKITNGIVIELGVEVLMLVEVSGYCVRFISQKAVSVNEVLIGIG